MRTLALIGILLISALPLAVAQHEGMMGGDGMALVLHDGPDDGRAVVGDLTHFGFALLDAKGNPTVHQNAGFLVVQNGETIFATQDTHEYDGMFSLDITFTKPGPYSVTAMSGKMAMGNFTGIALLPVNATVAKAVMKTTTDPVTNALGATLDIVGPDGKTIPHTDAIIEIRSKAGLLASRWHAHIHEAPIQFSESFGVPGDYVAHVEAYRAFPSAKSPDVQAVVADFPFTVGVAAAPVAPILPMAPPPALDPNGEVATAGGYTLHGMYDPQNQVGVGQTLRLSAVIEAKDAMEMLSPKPHVNFEFVVNGPRGEVFSSKSLHEYDGMFEWLYVPQFPGVYDAVLTAVLDNEKISVPYHVQVVPPVVPALGGTGPTMVTVDGLDKAQAGMPTLLTFHVDNPQSPAGHTEVDVTVFHKGEAPAFQFKLHGHDNATTQVQLTFPHGGDWLLAVDPLPTVPAPVVFAGPDGPGAPIVFKAKVLPGIDSPIKATSMTDVAPSKVPAPAFGLVAVGVVGIALLLRRR